jgi:hypothetical protein
MSIVNKNTNAKDHDGTGERGRNRGSDAISKTGHQSQDALRHQQDAPHHKDGKRRQPGGADSESGQQSQGGSRWGAQE